jgi:hypothetical protein
MRDDIRHGRPDDRTVFLRSLLFYLKLGVFTREPTSEDGILIRLVCPSKGAICLRRYETQYYHSVSYPYGVFQVDKQKDPDSLVLFDEIWEFIQGSENISTNPKAQGIPLKFPCVPTKSLALAVEYAVAGIKPYSSKKSPEPTQETHLVLLKRGTPPAEQMFQGTCSVCKSEFEVPRTKIKVESDIREHNEFAHAECPVCKEGNPKGSTSKTVLLTPAPIPPVCKCDPSGKATIWPSEPPDSLNGMAILIGRPPICRECGRAK